MFDLPWGDLFPFVFFGVVVADASVAIRGDMSGFHNDLKGAENEVKGTANRIQLTWKNILKAGGLFGLGTTLVGLTRDMMRGALDAGRAFADLQQTMTTVDSVFGDHIGTLDAWAAKSAEAAGMSQQTVYQSGALIGSTLKNMGFDIEEAVDWTIRLQQRAAEMAVAFGQTPEKAILAITAAIRGERDTIEKFGVSIKQAAVNAEVQALGLDTSTAALKANAEATAILNLVMDQTTHVAGRFEDSQDDIAVKMAQNAARIDDFMVTQVGPAVASIQLGAVKTGEAFVEASEGVGMFFDNIFSPEKQAQVQKFADEAGVTFNEMSAQIETAAVEAGVAWEEQLAYMVMASETNAGDMTMAGVKNVRAFKTGIESEPEAVTAGAKYGITDPVLDEMLLAEENANKSGYQVVIEYAKGLLTPQSDVAIAIEAALQVVEDEMSITEELAFLSGKRVVLENARGIAQSEGKDASVTAIDAALALIEERMAMLANKAYDYGWNTAGSYAAGIVNNLGVVHDAGRQLAQGVGSQARIESEPPDHSSPLYGITKWGGNIVKTIAGGITSNLGTASAASGALAGALVPSVGGHMSGVVGNQTISGNTYVLNVDGVPKTVDSKRAAIEELEKMGDSWQ